MTVMWGNRLINDRGMTMDKKIYWSILAALATVGAVIFTALLMAPFAEPLAWALIIGIATYPYYRKIADRFSSRPGRSAALMVAVITFCIILPAAGLVLAIAQNAADLYNQSQQIFHTAGRTGISAFSRFPLPDRILALMHRYGVDISGHAAEIASAVSKFMVNAATGAAANIARFVLTLVMAIFVLFFVYRDGEKIVNAGVSRFAGNAPAVRHYLSEISITTTAVAIGTILTCLVQGALAGVGYFFAGIQAPVLCGILTAIAALVPVVGTAIVWAPLAAYLAITGAYLQAILLAVWCIIFVGLADNVIRPLTIGAKSNIPTLAVILGAIGGAALIGLLGLFIGPIVFALLVSVWRDLTTEPRTET